MHARSCARSESVVSPAKRQQPAPSNQAPLAWDDTRRNPIIPVTPSGADATDVGNDRPAVEDQCEGRSLCGRNDTLAPATATKVRFLVVEARKCTLDRAHERKCGFSRQASGAGGLEPGAAGTRRHRRNPILRSRHRRPAARAPTPLTSEMIAQRSKISARVVSSREKRHSRACDRDERALPRRRNEKVHARSRARNESVVSSAKRQQPAASNQAPLACDDTNGKQIPHGRHSSGRCARRRRACWSSRTRAALPGAAGQGWRIAGRRPAAVGRGRPRARAPLRSAPR